MTILIWFVLGLIAGLYTVYFVEPRKDRHYIMDIILGVMGALFGGGLMYMSGISGPTLFGIIDTYTLFTAILGGGMVIWTSKYIIHLGQDEEL